MENQPMTTAMNKPISINPRWGAAFRAGEALVLFLLLTAAVSVNAAPFGKVVAWGNQGRRS